MLGMFLCVYMQRSKVSVFVCFSFDLCFISFITTVVIDACTIIISLAFVLILAWFWA